MGAAAFNNTTKGFIQEVTAQSLIVQNLNTTVTKLKTTVTGLAAGTGTVVENGIAGSSYNYVKSIPVSPTFTLEGFYKQVSSAVAPDKNLDSLSNALGTVTGININAVRGVDLSVDSIRERLREAISVVEGQVIAQIKDCIDSYLQSLLNKNPKLKIALDIEGAILNEIGKLRNKIKFKVEDSINKIAYQNIKIQQISLLKQRVVSKIRKICPGTHHSIAPVERISPTLTKSLQVDETWRIADTTVSIEQSALNYGPAMIAHASIPNSTGAKVISLVSEVRSDILVEGERQSVGYSSIVISDLVTVTGGIR